MLIWAVMTTWACPPAATTTTRTTTDRPDADGDAGAAQRPSGFDHRLIAQLRLRAAFGRPVTFGPIEFAGLPIMRPSKKVGNNPLRIARFGNRWPSTPAAEAKRVAHQPSRLGAEHEWNGALAQLGERYNGIVEVSGSIPLGSTIH
jgi:hypothetical protein